MVVSEENQVDVFDAVCVQAARVPRCVNQESAITGDQGISGGLIVAAQNAGRYLRPGRGLLLIALSAVTEPGRRSKGDHTQSRQCAPGHAEPPPTLLLFPFP